MKRCPKCAARYDGDPKICRECGAILEDNECTPPTREEGTAAETCPPPADNAAHSAQARPSFMGDAKRSSWTCQRCGNSVPGSFDVCWRCGTSCDGCVDPRFEKAVADAADIDTSQAASDAIAAAPAECRCPCCGSAKIIPHKHVKVLDRGQGSSGKLQIVVYGNPNALFFKDRLYATVGAEICGDCGHVELKVGNAHELYQHYRQF